MTKENRVKEILSSMQSFKKEAYRKVELLPEYLELQKEMINLTFNDNHAENGKLHIWDIENHFEKLNEECGHIADEELKVFKEGSKFICNAIKSILLFSQTAQYMLITDMTTYQPVFWASFLTLLKTMTENRFTVTAVFQL